MRGDILVSKSGSLGVCAIVDIDIEFSIYESIIVLQPKTSLNSNYLLWLMRDENTQLRMIGEKVGSSVAHLNIEMFRKLVIQKPPLLEQTAIAIVVSDTDDLIASLDTLIAKKRDIKQATMQQLLTGKTRLPGFAGDGRAKLGDFFELNPNKPYFNDTDLVSFIRMEDVSESGRIINQNIMPLSSIKKGLTYFERNDVLVAKITPCFENGKGACLDTLETKSGFGSTEFHILRAKKNAVPRYIFYQTQLPEFRNRLEAEMIGTAGQKRVPARTIIDYPLPIHHSREEQRALAAILFGLDSEIAALEQWRAKSRAL